MMKKSFFIALAFLSFIPLLAHAQGSTDTPWVWYFTRASGLVAFAFAWIVVFLGVAIRLPVLKKIISPV